MKGFYDSLWYHTAGPAPVSAGLGGADETDVAIIGAGITGLSAALHLARAGVRVTVLEAEDIGSAASGRNGGFVVPHFARSEPDEVISLLGEGGEALVDLVGQSARALFELVAAEGIDCDAGQAGWFQPAHSREAMLAIERRARAWAARGLPVRLRDGAETRQLTGCSGYVGSWSNATGGTLHPLKLVHGLARAAIARGARLFTHSEVLSLERRNGPWCLRTPGGELRAQWVLACTNALSRGLLPQLAKAVVPVKIVQAASAPLPPSWRDGLLRQGQSLSDTRRNLFTYRFDRDWRLITGIVPSWEWGAGQRLARTMSKRLQHMLSLPAAPPIQYLWHGEASISAGFLPSLYEIDTGLVGGTACNGRGVALSAELGRLMAQGVLDGSWRRLPIPLRTLRPVRLGQLVRLGARLYPLYGAIRDRL